MSSRVSPCTGCLHVFNSMPPIKCVKISSNFLFLCCQERGKDIIYGERSSNFYNLYHILLFSIRGIERMLYLNSFLQEQQVKDFFSLTLKPFIYMYRTERETQGYIFYFYGRNWEVVGVVRTQFKNLESFPESSSSSPSL